MVTAVYLKSELYHLQTTSWSDALSKNHIFTHFSSKKDRVIIIFSFYIQASANGNVQKRSKELQNILRVKGIMRGGMETRGNAGGPKLTWSSFRGFDCIFADYMSTSQSLCVGVSIALKLTWKIPVKQRFHPANTEGDTFCSPWWKCYTQMQKDKVTSRSFPHVYTHPCNNDKEAKMLKVTDMNKCWWAHVKSECFLNNTQHTLRFGVTF